MSRAYVVVLLEVRLRAESVHQPEVVLEGREPQRELAAAVQVVELLLDLLDDVRLLVLRVEQGQRERREDRVRWILDRPGLPAGSPSRARCPAALCSRAPRRAGRACRAS